MTYNSSRVSIRIHVGQTVWLYPVGSQISEDPPLGSGAWWIRGDNGSVGHGSIWSTSLGGSRGSRVSTRDPLIHDVDLKSFKRRFLRDNWVTDRRRVSGLSLFFQRRRSDQQVSFKYFQTMCPVSWDSNFLIFIIYAEHVVHRRGYCFHFGCMYVCMFVCMLAL